MGLPEYMDDLRWEAAYWELMALEKRRVWWSSGLSWWFHTGRDEYQRVTLVIGSLVIALWRCRCDDCKAHREGLRKVVDDEENSE